MRRECAGRAWVSPERFVSFHALERGPRGGRPAEPEIAQAALTELCQTYWVPLYSFVRGCGYAVHDAQDLTQSFFAYLIEYKIYVRVDRQKGGFRSRSNLKTDR